MRVIINTKTNGEIYEKSNPKIQNLSFELNTYQLLIEE